MSIDWWILLVKFLGIFFAGVFAMMPLIVDYRDAEKRITTWGKIALAGALTSTFVSALAQYLDIKKTSLDAQETLTRTNVLLTQVRSVLSPIKDLNLSACVAAPLEIPEMVTLANELKRLAAATENIESVLKVDADKNWLLLRDLSAVQAFKNDNRPQYAAISAVTFNIRLLKSQETLSEIAKRYNDYANEVGVDLRMGFISGVGDFEIKTTKNQFFYRDGRLFIIIQNVLSDPTYWTSDGKIVSIYDLVHWLKQMVQGDGRVWRGSRGQIWSRRRALD